MCRIADCYISVCSAFCKFKLYCNVSKIPFIRIVFCKNPNRIDIYKNFVFVQIIWMNPKRIVISERESRYIDDPRMSIERPFVGDYNLHIRNVRYDDRGEYTCTINTIPVQIKRIRLIVKGNHGILMFHHVLNLLTKHFVL